MTHEETFSPLIQETSKPKTQSIIQKHPYRGTLWFRGHHSIRYMHVNPLTGSVRPGHQLGLFIKCICVFVRRWSDRTEVEFQNWAEQRVGDERRKNGLCVTMSSSTGTRIQKHTLMHVYLRMPQLSEILLICCREVVDEQVQRSPRLRLQEKDRVCGGDSQGAALHRRMSRKMAVLWTQG